MRAAVGGECGAACESQELRCREGSGSKTQTYGEGGGKGLVCVTHTPTKVGGSG